MLRITPSFKWHSWRITYCGPAEAEPNFESSVDENVVNPDDVEVTTRAGDNSFVSSLLAHGDPGLVKVLLDDSKPENLQVFLHNADITIEELEDFIEV